MGKEDVGRKQMNNTLDRLKALNSKLEEKLSEKKKAVTPPKEAKGTEEPAASVKERKERKTPKRPAGKSPEQTAVPEEKSQESSESAAIRETLHRQLLRHLQIDAVKEPVRSENLARFTELYLKLDIRKKVPDIVDIFIYKAMNISGIGLKEEDFGQIRAGKYVQVIAITYEPDKNGKKKAKNISLGYFGKAEALEGSRKNEVIEFVLRWRYEKAFQNLEHYRLLLEKVLPRETLF